MCFPAHHAAHVMLLFSHPSSVMSTSVGSTLTSGVQDISALLPLLGTEQCEDMVGSALTGGYLYIAATSFSLFGCLGIVRAAFKVLIANITFKAKFIGAKKLHSAGFKPASDSVLSMILLDEKRYLAETKLESMLKDLHIDDASKLVVTPCCRNWNIRMILFTLTASIGFVPYIHLILHGQVELPVFLRWGYPIARIVGSVLTTTTIQIILQARIVEIIRQRLSFMVLDRAVEKTTDPTFLLAMKKQGDDEERQIMWDAQKPSEECFWTLYEYLSKHKPVPDEAGDEEKGIRPADSLKDLRLLVEKHKSSFERPYVLLLLGSLALLFGILFTVGGYIGCFGLVQSSQSKGSAPLIWLSLEASLSLLRILVWAWDPEFDERGTHLDFQLTLEDNPPLVTCNKYFRELDEEKVLPLVRDDAFLSEVTSYTGLLPRVDDDRISLYYSLTGDENTRTRVLYIVIFDYKEVSCRVFLRKPGRDQYVFYGASLKINEIDGTVHAELQRETDAKTNHVTQDVTFVNTLKRHYNAILGLLVNQQRNLPLVSPPDFLNNSTLSPHPVTPSDPPVQRSSSSFASAPNTPSSLSYPPIPSPPTPFTLPPESQIESPPISPPSPQSNNTVSGSRSGHFQSDWLLRSRTKRDPSEGDSLITRRDTYYLDTGKLEWQKRRFAEARGKWREEYMAVVRTETVTLQGLTAAAKEEDPQGLTVQEAEHLLTIRAEEAEVALMEEREEGENLLMEETELFEKVLMIKHQEMVERFVTTTSSTGVTDPIAIRLEKDRAKAVRTRLEEEQSRLDARREKEEEIDNRRMEEYGSGLAQVTRIVEEKRSEMNDRLAQKWRDVMKKINEGTKWDESMVVEAIGRYEEAMHDRLREMEKDREDGFDRINAPTKLREAAKARREVMKYRLVLERNKMKAKLQQSLELLTPQDSGEYKPVGSLLEHAVSLERMRPVIADLEVGVQTTQFVMIKTHWYELRKKLPSSDESDRCESIATALSRNPVVTVIDFSGVTLAISSKIARSLKNSRSLTSVVGPDPETLELDPETVEALLLGSPNLMSVGDTIPDRRASLDDHLQINQTLIFYERVSVVDKYRTGYPYVIFKNRAKSKCIVVFHPPEKKAISLKLNHCRTTSLGVIDITVNKIPIPYDNSLTPRDNLGRTTVPISSEFVMEGINELIIALNSESHGVYWLSDINLDME